MKKAIVWFRNDQRVDDNEALSLACQQHDEVIPVFIWDERWEQPWIHGIPPLGEHRRRFLAESLDGLRDQLAKRGGALIERTGNVVNTLLELSKTYKTNVVYASLGASVYEQEDQSTLTAKGIELRLFATRSLIHPNDLPMPIEKLPDVFTSFRHKVEKTMPVRPLVAAPEKISVPDITGPHVERPAINLHTHPIDQRAAICFVGGSTPAWLRIQDYCWDTQALRNYKESRNGLIGKDYSSKLSPWLALGNISAKAVYWEVKKHEATHGANESTYWLIFELLWRDYFGFVGQRYGNKLFFKKGIREVANQKSGFNMAAFARWCGGTTGQDFVDANMRELNATGFMSNRGRQNVASYLCKDIGIDWRAGAAYFEHMLIDYDPCSNYANWQYIAGVGNDPRTDRYFNVAGQAERYDADGEYRRLWLD